MSSSTDRIAGLLRGLPMLTGTAPAFDPATTPDEPTVLFEAWLRRRSMAALPSPTA